MTREFILETLLPYKQDSSNCGYKNGNCFYLTEDGKKCAIGKHMKEGPWQKELANISTLSKNYSLQKMLTKEAFEQNISIEIWQKMQKYHDTIIIPDSENLNSNKKVKELEELTNFKFPELYF